MSPMALSPIEGGQECDQDEQARQPHGERDEGRLQASRTMRRDVALDGLRPLAYAMNRGQPPPRDGEEGMDIQVIPAVMRTARRPIQHMPVHLFSLLRER